MGNADFSRYQKKKKIDLVVIIVLQKQISYDLLLNRLRVKKILRTRMTETSDNEGMYDPDDDPGVVAEEA